MPFGFIILPLSADGLAPLGSGHIWPAFEKLMMFTMSHLLQIFLTTGDLKNQEDCSRIVRDSVEYFNGQLDVLVSYEDFCARQQVSRAGTSNYIPR